MEMEPRCRWNAFGFEKVSQMEGLQNIYVTTLHNPGMDLPF